MRSKLKSFIENLIAVLIAAYCCVPSINDIVFCFIHKSTMTILYAIIIVSLVIVLLMLLIKGKRIVLDARFILILLYVVVFYIIGRLLGFTDIEPVYFVCWFVAPFSLFYLLKKVSSFSLKNLLFFISIIPSIGILVYREIFALSEQSTISMGTSYNFLTPVLACIACALFYFVKLSLVKKLLYVPIVIINAVYFFELAKHGSRGPILCVLFFLIIFLLVSFDDKKRKIIFHPIRALTALIVLVFAIVNLRPILVSLSSVFDSSILEKMIILYDNNNILNNRSNEFIAASSTIFDSIFIGHGISSFRYFTGYVYPHNIFLQLLFDGGIVLFLIFIVPLILSVAKLFLKSSKDDYSFALYFFSVAFVHALVSGNIWANEKLWLLYSYSLISLVTFSSVKRTRVHASIDFQNRYEKEQR